MLSLGVDLWPRLGEPGAVLVRGVALGLGAAVPIGPVNVQIARRALRHGFFAGFALGCGAVTADITYAVLSSLSFARLLDRPPVTRAIGVAGVLLLAYLGVSCFRAALGAWRIDPIEQPETGTKAGGVRGPGVERPGARSGYVTGLLMTLLNPMTLALWFTVVPATVKRTQEAGGELPITCAGVFIGTVAWVVTFSGLLARAGRPGRSPSRSSAPHGSSLHGASSHASRNAWMAAADAVGGATLLAFSGLALWRLVRPFL